MNCIECGMYAWAELEDGPDALLAEVANWVVESYWPDTATSDDAWVEELDSLWPKIGRHFHTWRLVCPVESLNLTPKRRTMVRLNEADISFLDEKGYDVPWEAGWWAIDHLPEWFAKSRTRDFWEVPCRCAGVTLPRFEETALVRPYSFDERVKWARWSKRRDEERARAMAGAAA